MASPSLEGALESEMGSFSFPAARRREPPYCFFAPFVGFVRDGVFADLSSIAVPCFAGDLACVPRVLVDDNGRGVRIRTDDGVWEDAFVLLF